ncbi:MAG: DEAD/DEAH box helicase family protein, partial [Pirellulaceae bacterium]
MLGGTYRAASGAPVPAARSVMIESFTGSGKIYMGLMIARALQQQTGAKIGWVAMRRNLLDQVQAENARHGFDVDLWTISMFDRKPPTDMDLLVADEGHHAAANSCVHLHNVIRPRWILGLTATPFLTDRVKLCFDAVVRDVPIEAMCANQRPCYRPG